MSDTAEVVLEIRFPADIYRSLRAEGFDQTSLSQEARENLALRLYAQHRLSLGKAAELAGLAIVKFMELLQSLQMPVTGYGEHEYAQDLQTIRELTQIDLPAQC
jgi:predicted HTH domain antitoxin